MGSHANSNAGARRRFLRLTLEVAAATAASVAVSAVAGCGGRPTCDDTSGLAKDDVQARRDHKYVDTGPDPAKRCAGCQQYRGAPSENACGGCEVLKGPVSPLGSCDLFAAKK